MSRKSEKQLFLEEHGFEVLPKGKGPYPFRVADHNRNGAKMYFHDLDNAYEAICKWYLPTKKPQNGAC